MTLDRFWDKFWDKTIAYRAEKKSLQNIFKQDPGRARQSS